MLAGGKGRKKLPPKKDEITHCTAPSKSFGKANPQAGKKGIISVQLEQHTAKKTQIKGYPNWIKINRVKWGKPFANEQMTN